MPLSRYGVEERRLDVVPGEAPGHLGEVVGAEGEELGGPGDLARRSARPGAPRSSCRSAACTSTPSASQTSASTRSDLLADRLQLLHRADQRDHDLRPRVAAGLLPLARRLGDRPHLHGEQARGRPAPAGRRAARASGSARACRGRRPAGAGCPRRARPAPRRRATRTDSSVRSGRNSCSGGSSSRTVTGRPSIASKISRKSCFCSGSRASSAACRSSSLVGQDQLLDQLPAVAEEHVLGPAQADALGAEPPGPRGVLRGVGVGADVEPPLLVGVGQDPVHAAHDVVGALGLRVDLALEVADDGRRLHRHLAQPHPAGRAVDGDDVALARRRCRRAR